VCGGIWRGGGGVRGVRWLGSQLWVLVRWRGRGLLLLPCRGWCWVRMSVACGSSLGEWWRLSFVEIVLDLVELVLSHPLVVYYPSSPYHYQWYHPLESSNRVSDPWGLLLLVMIPPTIIANPSSDWMGSFHSSTPDLSIV